ncbi:MAG: hypothetical protein DWQ31_14965 [Planctomycetota bacterium]|nr:MAG: hypothetical protein DWQ31_14965 [Planctomycetota bacterium]REJ96207.1 MAG: hypothetical protein DWQ35_05065 [Planctomycetota bacterium]REK29363.1 MAG: hypothetical protein DWQ42_03805 [Planctomycetota bacterium]
MNRRSFCLTLSALPVGLLTAPAAEAFPRLRRRGRANGPAAPAPVEAPPAAHAFSEQFDEADWWKTNWGVGMMPNHAERIDVARDLSGSGKGLHVAVPQGSNLGTDFSHYFRSYGVDEPETATFEYAIKFGPTFTGHGKLPGFVGTYGRGGWGGRKANGQNGWSARLGFSAANPEFVGVSYYSYHIDQKQSHGDSFAWRSSVGADDAPGFRFLRDQWYTLRGTVRLNTPGEADGELLAWIDGQPALAQRGMRFRDVERLKIERFWFNVWHGGGKPAPVDMDVTFANVRIS